MMDCAVGPVHGRLLILDIYRETEIEPVGQNLTDSRPSGLFWIAGRVIIARANLLIIHTDATDNSYAQHNGFYTLMVNGYGSSWSTVLS